MAESWARSRLRAAGHRIDVSEHVDGVGICAVLMTSAVLYRPELLDRWTVCEAGAGGLPIQVPNRAMATRSAERAAPGPAPVDISATRIRLG